MNQNQQSLNMNINEAMIHQHNCMMYMKNKEIQRTNVNMFFDPNQMDNQQQIGYNSYNDYYLHQQQQQQELALQQQHQMNENNNRHLANSMQQLNQQQQ